MHAEHAVGRGIGEHLDEALRCRRCVRAGAFAVNGNLPIRSRSRRPSARPRFSRRRRSRAMCRPRPGSRRSSPAPACPAIRSTQAIPSSSALCASIGPRDHVADRVDAGHIGREIARRPRCARARSRATPISSRPSPSVNGRRPIATSTTSAASVFALAARGRLQLQRDRFVGAVPPTTRVASLKLDAGARQDALHRRAELAVHAGQDAVEVLDDRHLRAEPRPDRAEFQPDIAAADHHQPLRHRVAAPARRSRTRCAARRSRCPAAGCSPMPVAIRIAPVSTSWPVAPVDRDPAGRRDAAPCP